MRVVKSNNIDELVSMFTDDVVFLATGAKPVIGKAAVRAWADEYFEAFKTHWDKSVREFVICGDYAFERYDYTSTYTRWPAAGQSSTRDGVLSSITTRATVCGGSHAMRFGRITRLWPNSARVVAPVAFGTSG